MQRSPLFPLKMHWIQRALLLLIAGVLAAVLLNKLENAQEFAERADVEYDVRVMRSALELELGLMMTRNRLAQSARLLCQNPIEWLNKRPPNYYGEARGMAVALVPAGNWYFDPVDCTMGYIVSNDRHFKADSQGLKRLRYRVTARNGGKPEIWFDFRLTPIEPPGWDAG